MSSNKIFNVFVGTCFAVAFICLCAIPFAIVKENQVQAECEARGGVWVSGRDIKRCFAKEAFK